MNKLLFMFPRINFHFCTWFYLMLFWMDTANIYLWLMDANSRFLHTITSYLACIPIWSQKLTTGVAPNDNEKTPCPRMNQKTFVPSYIIRYHQFNRVFKLYFYFLSFSLVPRFPALQGFVIIDASNDEFWVSIESVIGLGSQGPCQ